MSMVEQLKKRYYPGPSSDGTRAFYGWIRQHVTTNAFALNLGAGLTGKTAESCLKGAVRDVVGVDLNISVGTNSDLDSAVVGDGAGLPFKAEVFDLAWADYVLEHIPSPLVFLREVIRVLKPGGSFFFRTPNKNHYVPLVSSLTPYWFHRWASPRLQGQNPKGDLRYPTFYRFNEPRTILATARQAGFQSTEFHLIEPEPGYLSFHPVAFLAGVAYERTVNRYSALSCFRANILSRLVK